MSARCPICYKEMHIIEDNLYEGMGPQGIPVLRTIYIPKCLSCGYSLDPFVVKVALQFVY